MGITIYMFLWGTIFLLSWFARRYNIIKQLYLYLSVITVACYLVWRLLFTMKLSTIWGGGFTFFLVFIETGSTLVFILFTFLFLFDRKEERIVIGSEDEASVDILICTRDEDIKLVIAAAMEATKMVLVNKHVYICDDGSRPKLAKKALLANLNYISREANREGKQENINNALKYTSSEFFLILDAEFILSRKKVRKAFYAMPSFEVIERKIYIKKDLFTRFIEPKLAVYNKLIHLVANTAIGRKVVETGIRNNQGM
ncbi:MAG: glycosyltransferase [Culicoidibacterales bacterium]